jgi:hypothetical protein
MAKFFTLYGVIEVPTPDMENSPIFVQAYIDACSIHPSMINVQLRNGKANFIKFDFSYDVGNFWYMRFATQIFLAEIFNDMTAKFQIEILSATMVDDTSSVSLSFMVDLTEVPTDEPYSIHRFRLFGVNATA